MFIPPPPHRKPSRTAVVSPLATLDLDKNNKPQQTQPYLSKTTTINTTNNTTNNTADIDTSVI